MKPRQPARYIGVQLIRTGHCAGRWRAGFRYAGKFVDAGMWLDELKAALAHDRLALHLSIDRPLNLPKRSRKLGSASANELRRLARLEHRLHSGRSPYEGVSRRQNGFRNGCFDAAWRIDGVVERLGTWPTEKEAALAVDRVRLHAGIRGATLYFPDDARRLGPASKNKRHSPMTGLRCSTSAARRITSG